MKLAKADAAQSCTGKGHTNHQTNKETILEAGNWRELEEGNWQKGAGGREPEAGNWR